MTTTTTTTSNGEAPPPLKGGAPFVSRAMDLFDSTVCFLLQSHYFALLAVCDRDGRRLMVIKGSHRDADELISFFPLASCSDTLEQL